MPPPWLACNCVGASFEQKLCGVKVASPSAKTLMFKVVELLQPTSLVML